MKQCIDDIRPGLYIVYWKSGGSSLASFGVTREGNLWIAPINWVFPGELDNKAHDILYVEKVLDPVNHTKTDIKISTSKKVRNKFKSILQNHPCITGILGGGIIGMIFNIIFFVVVVL